MDNDGDLDLVINNINDPVLLMENHSNELTPEENFLRIKLIGDKQNPEAIGSTVITYYDNKQQRQSLLSGRGYLSQPEKIYHVGLGKIKKIDSLKIIWPNGKIQIETSPTVNKLNKYTYRPSSLIANKNNTPLFTKASKNLGLGFYRLQKAPLLKPQSPIKVKKSLKMILALYYLTLMVTGT